MSSPVVIVFGPTGNVGSAVALTAYQLGAKVVLAMRDTSQPIPTLTPELEKAGGVIRVHADLSNPETVDSAVRNTRAKHAFIYLIRGDPEHMRGVAETLKSAGITLVVFLSSASVRGDIREIPATEEYLAYAHARVEVNLQEVFGRDGYFALRPAFFNTNISWWMQMVREGHARVAHPEAKFDFIAPEDIGKVGGNVLDNSVILCGPKLICQRNAIGILGDELGKKVHVSEVHEDEIVKSLVKGGMPESAAKNLLKSIGQSVSGNGDFLAGIEYEKGSANLHEYVEVVTQFPDWVKLHKELLI
ncbi:hypothetical protein BX600DRAFT_483824 [Xylariales sp. PMI_506]|nr:hypothetical protein BX600DRAFT_483824 [Xylariales sp. PMI_506]